MSNLKKAVIFVAIITAVNLGISALFYFFRNLSEFKGFMTGTILNLVFSALWVFGARKGMRSNTLVLLMITLGGFPVRLGVLAVFAFGGLYLFQMDTTMFAVSFLIGTIASLIVEVWFFNTLRFTDGKKF